MQWRQICRGALRAPVPRTNEVDAKVSARADGRARAARPYLGAEWSASAHPAAAFTGCVCPISSSRRCRLSLSSAAMGRLTKIEMRLWIWP